MTAEITAIHESNRTPAQDDVIQAAAEVVKDMPNLLGYCISIWDSEGCITIVEPWPHNPQYVAEIVSENVKDFFEVVE